MADFTIEQLEALKEGTTPGTWCATDEEGGSDLIIDETGESLLSVGSIAEVWASFSSNADGKIAAAAPDLVDALIAEKQAYQKLRDRIERRIGSLKVPLCSHMPEGDELDDLVEQWAWQSYEAEVLTRILEADNE